MSDTEQKQPTYTDRLVEHLETLNFKEIKKIVNAINDFRDGERKKMLQEKQSIPDHCMPLGKYKGKSVYLITQLDPQYLTWVRRQKWCKNKILEHIDAALDGKPQPE